MKKSGSLTLFLFFALLTAPQAIAQDFDYLEMGVNVNERPHWLKQNMLEKSQTTWVRVFIEASHYIKGERSLDDDFRIDSLKAVADEGYKTIVSIKWDLSHREANWLVPEAGSDEEMKWFEFARDLLEVLDGDISILVLNNELTIDTRKEDLQPNENGLVPFIEFQKRLLDYISELNPQSADNKPLPIYSGGFTRLDKKESQENPANQAMLQWIREDDRLTGANFHMHQPDFKTSMEAASYIRQQLPEKSLIVTEFSLIWKWQRHLNEKIVSTEAGRNFAENYELDPDMTFAEYSTHAFRNPVSEQEWQDFMKSQHWFEPEYLDVIGRIMENAGVDVATYAFTQHPFRKPGDNSERIITNGATPWYVQQLFMPEVAVSDTAEVAVNYSLFDSFVKWQKVTQKLKEDSGYERN